MHSLDVAKRTYTNDVCTGFVIYNSGGCISARTTDYASRWLKFADKRSSALKAYLLSPFLYGHAHQSDRVMMTYISFSCYLGQICMIF